MGEISVRILAEGEEAIVEAFLLPRLDSSMLLFGNIQARGLAYQGQRYEGIYAGVFNGPDLIGVAAHYWNQNLILQAPSHIKTLARTVFNASRRPLGGLLGPNEQVQEAKEVLGLSSSELRYDEVEKLYGLKVNKLVVPEILTNDLVRGRLARSGDIDTLAKWRIAYLSETMDEPEIPGLDQSSRQAIKGQIAENRTWVIERKGELVATSSFNASVQNAAGVGIVQVGGVWTPPALRSQGYGRAAVATSLVDARARGIQKAVLFTGEGNYAAQKAYSALGFKHIGAYRLTFLHHPLAL